MGERSGKRLTPPILLSAPDCRRSRSRRQPALALPSVTDRNAAATGPRDYTPGGLPRGVTPGVISANPRVGEG